MGGGLTAGVGGEEPDAVAAEYAAAREGAALADLSDRGVLAVTGPQRQKFLQGILSNEVAALAPGQGCRAALMTAKGHLVAFLRVLVEANVVRLELPQERLEAVEKLLVYYKVAAPVRFAAQPTAVLGLLGPQARDVMGAAGLALPELALEAHLLGTIAGEPVLVARAGDLPAHGLVVHAAKDAAAAVRSALAAAGARPLGRSALDALRVEEGRAWYGPDVTEDNLLHETGLLAEYHSPAKGCYVGQETVARLEARGGHVSRYLRGLRLSAPARSGDEVLASSRPAGHVTTAAVSPRLGAIALAYVHRDHAEPGTEVAVGGAAARVAALPL